VKVNEIFYDFIESNWLNKKTILGVLKNPSKSELKKLKSGVRIIVDIVNKNVYVFKNSSLIMHDEVAKHIYGKEYNNLVNKRIFYGYGRDNGEVILFKNSKGKIREIKKIVNKYMNFK